MNSLILPAKSMGAWPAPQFLNVIEGQRLIHAFRHDRATGVIVQLIAATVGEGTSSVVRDLALIAARTPGARVLLLDVTSPGNSQLAAIQSQFGVASLAKAPFVGAPGGTFIHQLALGGLHVSEARLTPDAPRPDWATTFARLRVDFDLILVDSPAIDHSYDGIMLASDVDTNLLVVEAERTRSAVAQNLRDRILDVGGAIAGVLLNKQRYYIPAFIYRRI